MPVSNPPKAEGSKPISKQNAVTNSNRNWANLEQYMLVQNIDKVEDYYLNNQNLFNYFTFRQINGAGAQLINKLKGIDNLDVFYKIKTSTLSLMQPKIRIYKVNYEEFQYGPDGKPDEKTLTSLTTPCYKEFKFSDNFGQETAATVEDYLAYESTKPNFRNVGLKSFTVEQDGRTHGVIENNIKCKLEVVFKSLKDLNASPPGEPGLRYVDFILWPPARYTKGSEHINPMHYEIKVLLGYTAPATEQLNALNLSSRDIRAISNIEKLNTMYSLSLLNYDIKIKDDGQVHLTAMYRGRLETTIGSNQVNIFQDSFRIGDAGNFEVFKAADSTYNTSNIYKLSSSIQAIYESATAGGAAGAAEALEKIRPLVLENKIFNTILKDTLKSKGRSLREVGLRKSNKKIKIASEADFLAWFVGGDNADTLLAVLKSKIGAFKADMYKTFVDQLIDGNDTPDFRAELGTRLFCFRTSPEKISESTGRKLKDSGDTPGQVEAGEAGLAAAQGASQLTTVAGSDDNQPSVIINRCHKTDPLNAKVAAEAAEEIKDDLEGTSASEEETNQKAAPDDARKSTFNTGDDYKFYFVYLGDIIELACKNARLGQLDFDNQEKSIFPWQQYVPDKKSSGATSYPLQNARILLGPMEYKAPDGKIKSINLAQFPVSFKFFRAWFLNKVVRRRATQMSLGEFLSQLMNTLVLPGLYAGMPKSSKPRRTRTNMISLTLPGMQSPGPNTAKACGENLPMLEEILPLERRMNVDDASFKYNYTAKITQPRSSESMIKTSFDYLLVYMSTFKDITERTGDPAEDVKDGIYHFNIGSDMGLLKNMSFKKVNVPFLAEMRSEEAEERGVDQLAQLKIPYNTDLKLIGTTLFTPGMFYYVNPSLAGLGSVEDATSLAFQMHLGGYHLITKISTSITSGKFETSVTGKQQ